MQKEKQITKYEKGILKITKILFFLTIIAGILTFAVWYLTGSLPKEFNTIHIIALCFGLVMFPFYKYLLSLRK